MDHEYEADLLTLLDDEGQEHEFEIIDELENDDGHFLALVPTQQEPDEIASDAETYYIFEVIEEDGRNSCKRWTMTPFWISWPASLRSALTRRISTAKRNNPPLFRVCWKGMLFPLAA